MADQNDTSMGKGAAHPERATGRMRASLRQTFQRMRGALSGLVPSWLRALDRRVRIAAGVVAVLMLAVGIFVLLLPFLPLPTALVTPRVTAAIAERLGPGFRVSIGRASLDRGETAALLRLRRFTILDDRGRSVLEVPAINVGLAYAADRFLGLGDPRFVEVDTPEVTLRLEPGGGITLSGGDVSVVEIPTVNVRAAAARPVAELVATLDGLLGPGGMLAQLERIQIRDANVVVDDQRHDVRNDLRHVEASFTRTMDGGLSARVASADPGHFWAATATLSPDTGNVRALDLGLQNINLGKLFQSALSEAEGLSLEGRMSGHLYAGLNQDYMIDSYEARLDMAGVLVTVGSDAPMRFDRVQFDGRWDFEVPRLFIRRLAVQSGWGGGHVRLDATPSPDDENVWEYAFDGSNLLLRTPGAGGVPVLIEQLRGEGRLLPETRSVWLDQFILSGPGVNIAGGIGLDWSGERPVIDAALSGVRVPSGVVVSLWPPAAAPRTRRWIVENVKGGLVEDIAIAFRGPLAIPAPAPGEPRPRLDVAMDGRFIGAEIALKDQPVRLTDARGTMHAARNRLEIAVESGQLAAGEDRASVTRGSFVMPDLVPPDPAFELNIDMEGEAPQTLRLLTALDKDGSSAPFLNRLEGGTLKGNILAAGMSLPGGGMQLTQRRASFATEDVALKGFIGALDVTKARLAIGLDDDGITLSGDAALDGAPVAVNARARRMDKLLGDTVLTLTGDLSRMPNVPEVLKGVAGPTAVRVQMPRPGQMEGAQITADVTGARLSIAGADIKPSGRAGAVSFSIRQGDGRTVLDGIRFEAGAARASGRIEIAPGGGLQLARFDQLAFAEGDNARLEVTSQGSVTRATVRGASLDVRRFLDGIRKGPSDGRASVDLDVQLNEARAHNDVVVSGMKLVTRQREGTLQSLELEGKAGNGSLRGRTMSGGVIALEAADAGAVLRGVNLYRRVRGGALELVLAPEGRGRSFLAMRDFEVAGEAALASFTSSSPQGAVRFSKMRATFLREPGQIVIEESAIWGPDVGATLDGIVNFDLDQVNLSGTFVPAYALNNFFAQIPIIGPLLGGGQYEGLLGVTFQVSGPVGNPTMRVNPASAIAPGFLRKLFEFRNQDPSAGRPLELQPARPPQPD